MSLLLRATSFGTAGVLFVAVLVAWGCGPKDPLLARIDALGPINAVQMQSLWSITHHHGKSPSLRGPIAIARQLLRSMFRK